MKRIVLCVCLMALAFSGGAFSKDNVCGDYLILGSDKAVSLDLENARLVDVLKMFSQQTGLNFVSTEAVRDRLLTLYLDAVPLEEAMDTIFDANNLAYDYFPESNIFVVKEMGKPSIELVTRVYHLKYSCVSSSRIAKGFSAESSEEGDNSGGIEEAEGVGTSIKDVVEKVLSENGSVSEEPRINALIVTDVPSQFPVIEQVVKELDRPALKVLIEVEVLDIVKGDLKEFGMMANYQGHTSKKKHFSFMDGATSPLDGILTSAITGINGGTMGTLTLNEFKVMMSFLKQKTSTRLLAQPKLLVLSHQEAIIHVGNEIWSKDVEHYEDGTSSTVQIGDKKTQTGVQLQIIPQVNSGDLDDITLVVSVEISDDFADAGDNFFTKPTRSVNTIARLTESETLLVGGLIRKDDSDSREKIPFFGDIPLLGSFFRSRSNDQDERELVIFITPRILEEQPYFAGKQRGPRFAGGSGSSRRQAVRFALDKFSR